MSRLVPYLLENREDVKSLALTEMAGLLQNGNATFPIVDLRLQPERNMEHINDLKLIPSLWTMLNQPTLTTENKSKGLGVASLIASKGVSLGLSTERVDTLLLLLLNPQTAIESTKAIAFLSMQGQNKPLFVAGGVINPLFSTMASHTDEMDLQWASMAVYYLASACMF